MNFIPKQGLDILITSNFLLLPNWTSVKNFRSVVLAATERDHGAKLERVARSGPRLPAEVDVNIPFLIA